VRLHQQVSYMPMPLTVWWDVTHRCNLACRQCFSDSGLGDYEGELGTEEAKDLIDQLRAMCVFSIYFLGGEPLMRRDLLALLTHCQQCGVYPVVTTNGWFVTPQTAVELAAVEHLRVNVSIDGATEETHDWVRGRRGSFERAGAAVRHLVAAGVGGVGVIQTVMAKNLDETPALIDLAAQLGAATFQAVPLTPCGRGTEIIEEMALAGQDYGVLEQHVLEGRERWKGKMVVASTPGIADLPNQSPELEDADIPDFMGCEGGRTICNIDANGDVLPCSLLREPVAGNVRVQPFREIWLKSPVFRHMRRVRDDVEECRVCKYKYVCARACPIERSQKEGASGSTARRCQTCRSCAK